MTVPQRIMICKGRPSFWKEGCHSLIVSQERTSTDAPIKSVGFVPIKADIVDEATKRIDAGVKLPFKLLVIRMPRLSLIHI